MQSQHLPYHSRKSEMPSHTTGTARGEEWVVRQGREPGRHDQPPMRTAADSSGVNAKHRGPIDPRMPHIPPA